MARWGLSVHLTVNEARPCGNHWSWSSVSWLPWIKALVSLLLVTPNPWSTEMDFKVLNLCLLVISLETCLPSRWRNHLKLMWNHWSKPLRKSILRFPWGNCSGLDPYVKFSLENEQIRINFFCLCNFLKCVTFLNCKLCIYYVIYELYLPENKMNCSKLSLVWMRMVG